MVYWILVWNYFEFIPMVDYVYLTQDVLMKLGLDIKKCRGHGYDGASVMSGAHSERK